MRSYAGVFLLIATALPLQAQSHPRDHDIHDADTLAWWHTTEALSGDAMEGRDTGTAAYQRAATYVAKRFADAGLKPAGDPAKDQASYFQTVPMHEVDAVSEGTSFTYTRPNTAPIDLPFLREVSITVSPNLPAVLEGPITFRGYCGKDAMAEIGGKFVICYGARRQGLTTAAERLANARAGGALGVLSVDDAAFILEPARWPDAYARSVTLRQGNGSDARRSRGGGASLVTMRLSTLAFSKLVAGGANEPGSIIMAAAARLPLPSFDLPGSFSIHTKTAEKDIESPNVLGVLEGSDPTLREEYVVAAAHLDGYGFGTPVKGDNLYNGTLDDAAYVALLIQMADDIKAGRLPRPKRSILICAFTGEEKGLLGSNWFVEHPTVPKTALVADVNLDQLRPLFPLHILTALAIHDTTLGATATKVGAGMGIELREDREPERGLLRRADHFPFLRIGVPAIGFIFGYDSGTDAERRYREWYDIRYHRPQDDLTQPVDFDAAAKFDQFFYKLVGAIADAPTKPAILPSSSFAVKP
ncbi:MAG TPA: M28 family peptidase [Acidobacteriaceae bacterium]|jgi:hypothetical protein